jgi:hypothetical protein
MTLCILLFINKEGLLLRQVISTAWDDGQISIANFKQYCLLTVVFQQKSSFTNPKTTQKLVREINL